MPDITPSMLANSIMGKLYDVLTNGDATVPKSDDNFFSWCTPGIPVDASDFDFLSQGFTGVVKPESVKTLRDASAATAGTDAGGDSGGGGGALTEAQLDQLRAQDVAKLYMQAEALARIVDFVPDVSRINNDQFAKFAVMNDDGALSEIYERVLVMSQVMQSDIPAEVKAKLDHMRSLLVATTEKTDLITGEKTQVAGPSPLAQVYNQKMAAYLNAALEYNNRRIDALAADNPKAVSYWAMNANILRESVKAAMADWIASGYKEQWEQIAAFIAQVEGRDLTLLKQAYLDDLRKAKLTGLASGSDFYYTALAPGDFAKSTGWSNFSFASTDFKSHAGNTFNSSGWNASASGGYFGIFGGRGAAGSSTERREFTSTFNSDTFALSFQVAQIPIIRPWFKSSYLASKMWRFDPSNPDLKSELLSDGGRPPKGLLPAYPTSVIFIRNLSLQFGNNSGFSNFLSEQKSASQSGGGALSLGPFFLGGSANHFSKSGNTQRDFGYQTTQQGLTVPGMQIAGFKCHVIPKSPDPSPDIKNWV